VGTRLLSAFALYDEDQSAAYEFVCTQAGDNVEQVLAPAAQRLRSAGLMQRLSNSGYLPAGFRSADFSNAHSLRF
jgi:hypothetical protein